jgi:hypothetical protein
MKRCTAISTASAAAAPTSTNGARWAAAISGANTDSDDGEKSPWRSVGLATTTVRG